MFPKYQLSKISINLINVFSRSFHHLSLTNDGESRFIKINRKDLILLYTKDRDAHGLNAIKIDVACQR